MSWEMKKHFGDVEEMLIKHKSLAQSIISWQVYTKPDDETFYFCDCIYMQRYGGDDRLD